MQNAESIVDQNSEGTDMTLDLKEELDSEEKRKRDMYCLQYFSSALFATILEDTITALRILAECNTEMRISKTMVDMQILLANKYDVKKPAEKDELDGIDPSRLTCEEYKLNKLDADRKYLNDVLISTYTDLSTNKCFRAMYDSVKKIEERDAYLQFLLADEAKNKAIRRNLTTQLRHQRNNQKSVIYDNEVIIDTLKTKVEDAELIAAVKSRYVDNWQNARTEQHTESIKEQESSNSNSIEYYKTRTDHEQRVHSEIELLTSIAINETLQKVEDWMEKYDKDMEAIDLKIQLKKNDYQNMLEKRIHFEKTIEQHDQAMKAWIKFKEDREKALQYTNKMTTSAIIVQAWWRGLLVRRQLGPFRPKKKGGGKKK